MLETVLVVRMRLAKGLKRDPILDEFVSGHRTCRPSGAQG